MKYVATALACLSFLYSCSPSQTTQSGNQVDSVAIKQVAEATKLVHANYPERADSATLRRAVSLIDSAIQRMPEYTYAHNTRAIFSLMLGDTTSCLGSLDRAVLTDTTEYSLLQRAAFLAKSGQEVPAREDLEQALRFAQGRYKRAESATLETVGNIHLLLCLLGKSSEAQQILQSYKAKTEAEQKVLDAWAENTAEYADINTFCKHIWP